jgi:hypothetical protein
LPIAAIRSADGIRPDTKKPGSLSGPGDDGAAAAALLDPSGSEVDFVPIRRKEVKAAHGRK